MLTSQLPKYMKPQQWPHDEAQCEKLMSKLRKVRKRGYIQPGFVKSLTGHFTVPTVKTNIRVVFDATQCRLNNANVGTQFLLAHFGFHSYNWLISYPVWRYRLGQDVSALDMDVCAYTEVDVTKVAEASEMRKRVLERWTRTLMGFRPSPYIATQMFVWSKEVIVRDYLDPSKPFYCDEVRLNQPGTKDYDPSMPWIYHWNSIENCLPGFFGTYTDDIQMGHSHKKGCKKVSRQVASQVNYLGQQDIARKRGQPLKTPQAWTGAKYLSIEGSGLYVLSTQEKWNKTKCIVDQLTKALDAGDQILLEYSTLEKDVGFLCHISRTYPVMFPYLKGFYNT